MKVSTENDNNLGYEKITILVDNIPLSLLCLKKRAQLVHAYSGTWKCLNRTTLYPNDIFRNLTRTETSSYVFISTIKDKKVSLNLLLYAT